MVIFKKYAKMLKEDKRTLAFIAITTFIAFFCVGTTTAYLTSVSGLVENTFTYGDIQLELTETTGASYQLIPGHTIKKDPRVRVVGGSEDCWLFVQITESSGFDDYLSYEIADGWTHLGGYEGVYYRSIVDARTDLNFSILKDDSITVKDNLTEEKMSAITSPPTVSFKAYAIQSHAVDTAAEAWLFILAEGEG